MPNFTHRIYNPNWHGAYLVDELEPGVAYSEVDGRDYRSKRSWVEYYSDGRPNSTTVVERIGYTSLENK